MLIGGRGRIPEAPAAMSERISFRQGDDLLVGRFYAARGGDPTATVLLLQGSPGNPDDVLGLGERLSLRSCNVLTFNYRGTLDSEGVSSFENAQADIAAAHDYLATRLSDQVEVDQIIVGGWSYGGGMGLAYAANHPEVSAVFSIAGTDHGAFLREYERDPSYREMIDQMFDEMARPSSPWRMASGATPREVVGQGGRLDDYDLQMLAPKLATKHLLLIGAWDDQSVKMEHHILPLYRELARLGVASVAIEAFADDHSFGNVRDDLAETVLAWIARLREVDS